MAWDDGMTHTCCPQCPEGRCHCHDCVMALLTEREEAREAARLLLWLPGSELDAPRWIARYPWLEEGGQGR